MPGISNREKFPLRKKVLETKRHRTSYLVAGPDDAPLMIFMHGHPELGIYWRKQIEHFAPHWRCVAPDMRGYGDSSQPADNSAYTVREIVGDMAELHDALGGQPAVWVGHDWGSAICWTLATHYPQRCRAVINMNVPYLPEGLVLPRLVELVDRDLYPLERYPVGQWDYWLFHRESFGQSSGQLEVDVEATVSAIYQTSSSEGVDKPAWLADVRAQGGWFGPAGRAPSMPRDPSMLTLEDYDTFVQAYRKTGFKGANAWYLNDDENSRYAAEALNGGRIALPAFFLHGAWDTVCKTIGTRLADPMRAYCDDLSEEIISGGHFFSIENPAATNAAMEAWLVRKGLQNGQPKVS
ncbi:alpha/beta hydrolase [Mesorhizobium sp.]|uniref:alpha/beta hydrolase n=1 Tax=Mesorhizobium sp. TaxID=1871066 RepID=UPI0025B82844|nr:alpha/beta hydrolase [Mesorhizobium sp.]